MVKGRQSSWISKSPVYSMFRAYWREGDISADEAASTLFRFIQSAHVRDLRLIVESISILFLVFTATMIVVAFTSAPEHLSKAPPSGDLSSAKGASVFIFVAGYLGPALGATGFIIAWAYRSAVARLGVIDLFACEISTLCRVGTIMDLGSRFVWLYYNPPKAQDSIDGKENAGDRKKSTVETSFTSEEDYFPILKTNATHLQLLEALVVKDITEFYTYLKAARDALRKFAEFEPPQTSDSAPTAWSMALTDAIYMQFLANESGRKAIERLVEFEPTRAEARIMILITELTCYSFLFRHFPSDSLPYVRLNMRREEYKQMVEELEKEVTTKKKEDEKAWAQAEASLPELRKRYRTVEQQVAGNVIL
jgi:hypothetical protein